MNDKRGTRREEKGRKKCGRCSKEQRRNERKGKELGRRQNIEAKKRNEKKERKESLRK